ncbi:glycosyltransferase family 4 protein [Labilibacter marinus]|uniref:glycosyltransferase family 4 protein n=1 Tax=Labilibacter marinus TaxID=1477105 RepID=UPI000831B762|nr:glycosyltransferase family 4 protein [Labilibacter marinus]
MNKKYKILWFTNSPVRAKDIVGSKTQGGGWMDSLQEKLEANKYIELHICFNWSRPLDRFEHSNSIYHPVYTPMPSNVIKRKFEKGDVRKDNQIRNYEQIVNDIEPDVINVFGSEGLFGLIIPKIKVPVVIWFQGSIHHCNLKWNTFLSNKDLLKYGNLKRNVKGRGILARSKRLLKTEEQESDILKSTKFIIGRTAWDKRILKIMAPNAKYFHVEEMLREPFYNEKWQKKRTGTFKIISVLSPQTFKGFEAIFGCMERLNAINNHIEWHIVGCNGKEEVISIFCKKMKLDPDKINVKFRGLKNPNEMVKLFLDSDLFVHTSHIENSSNAIQEAMLMGMPVIATAVGGTPSILKNGVEGILVQAGDWFELAGAILDLKENEEVAQSLGMRARSLGLKRQETDKIVNDLVNVYQEITNEANKLNS